MTISALYVCIYRLSAVCFYCVRLLKYRQLYIYPKRHFSKCSCRLCGTFYSLYKIRPFYYTDVRGRGKKKNQIKSKENEKTRRGSHALKLASLWQLFDAASISDVFHYKRRRKKRRSRTKRTWGGGVWNGKGEKKWEVGSEFLLREPPRSEQAFSTGINDNATLLN